MKKYKSQNPKTRWVWLQVTGVTGDSQGASSTGHRTNKYFSQYFNYLSSAVAQNGSQTIKHHGNFPYNNIYRLFNMKNRAVLLVRGSGDDRLLGLPVARGWAFLPTLNYVWVLMWIFFRRDSNMFTVVFKIKYLKVQGQCLSFLTDWESFQYLKTLCIARQFVHVQLL